MGLRKYLFCALWILLFIQLAKCEEQEAEPEHVFEDLVLKMTSDTFDMDLKKNNYFIMFFAPWCGHCKRFYPIWVRFAELLNTKGKPRLLIGTVDCTEEKELCIHHEITGYPTLRLFKMGQPESIKYTGSREMPEITEFLSKQLYEEQETLLFWEGMVPPEDETSGKVIELTEEDFARHVSTGNHFVKFYAPWCSHCQRLAPTWDDLARVVQFEFSVTINKIDCTVHRTVCKDFEVKGYPTLLWIEDGKKIDKYTGSRDIGALKAYVKKMLSSVVLEEPKVVKDKVEEDQTKVLKLTAVDFEKTIADGVTFVKFYAPWCGHCQKLKPIWEQLASKFDTRKDVKIANVDCTLPANKPLCAGQDVEGYPTLFVYKNGEKQPEYDGARSLSELQHYINKVVGHDEL